MYFISTYLIPLIPLIALVFYIFRERKFKNPENVSYTEGTITEIVKTRVNFIPCYYVYKFTYKVEGTIYYGKGYESILTFNKHEEYTANQKVVYLTDNPTASKLCILADASGKPGNMVIASVLTILLSVILFVL